MSIRLEQAKIRTPGVTINSIPYIGRGSIQGIGLIFVSTNNIVGRLVGSIIKQEYTSMGFYILTTIRGSPSVQVIMIDHWSGLEPMKMCTLDDLLSMNDIDKIALKRIHEKYENKARLLLSNYLLSRDYSIPSIRNDLKYVFGVGEPNLVDLIMFKLGIIKTSDSVSVKVLERSSNIRVDPTSVIEYVGSCMNQQIPSIPGVGQIQSYLEDSTLLGQLLQLKPIGGTISTETDISPAISTFIDLLQDGDFLQVVVDGIKEGRSRSTSVSRTNMNIIEEALEISSTSRVEDLSDIADSISRGCLDVEELNEIIQRTNSDHIEACNFLSSGMEPIQVSKINIVGTISLTSRDESIGTHRDLRDEVERLSKVIKQSIDSSSIVFDDVMVSLNSIRENIGMKTLGYLGSSCKFNLIKSHRDISIDMSSGDEIIIPISSSTDLSMLERNDLLEILQRLDILLESGSYPEYDIIRKNIAYELSSR